MAAGVPLEICCYCPECRIYTRHRWVGEHDPYWVYECEICGRSVLILKVEVGRFTDFKPCGGE